MSEWRSEAGGIVVGLLLTCATVVVVFALWAATSDLAPDGATCFYEQDPGSGPSGLGTEEVQWGAFSHRVCVQAGLPGSGSPEPFSFLVALACGVLVGALGARGTQRLLSSGSPSPAPGDT